MSNDRFDLTKGQRFNLSKGGDTNFFISLEWDEPTQRNGVSYDLDASVFACSYNSKQQPKIVSDGHFVYYGRAPKPGEPFASSDNAIHHSGDQTSGDRDGEQVRVYLDRLDKRVEIMSVVVTIHKALARKQNFGDVANATIRVFNMDEAGDPLQELFAFDLKGDYSNYTAVHFGDIYLNESGDWEWISHGRGFERTELGDIVNIYC